MISANYGPWSANQESTNSPYASLHPLKVLRNQRNLTRQMLADFTQLSVSTIERAERGLPLRPDVRQRLCEYFGKTSTELGLQFALRQDKKTERNAQ